MKVHKELLADIFQKPDNFLPDVQLGKERGHFQELHPGKAANKEEKSDEKQKKLH